MATVSAIRTGIATTLSSISGLRTSATMLDDPKPPVAMVMPERVEYDLTARRGADRYTFVVQVLVSRADERTAQNNIDPYVTGATSVKEALFADPTLGGAAQTSRVTEMRSYGQVLYGETLFLGVEFVVEVYA
jgi:hypothetical protein